MRIKWIQGWQDQFFAPLPDNGLVALRQNLSSDWFVWSLVLLLGLYSPLARAARNDARSLEQNRARLQQVVNRLHQEQSALDQAKGQEKTLLGELEILDRQLADDEQRRKELMNHANQLKEQVPELTQQIQILKGEQERARHLLNQQLRMAYGIGEQGMLKMLFSSQDVGKRREGVQYFGYLIQARNRRFLEYRDTVVRLDAAIKGHKALLERLEKITAKQETERQQLLHRREERATLLQRVKKDAETRDRQVAELAQSQERLETFVTRLETLLQEEKIKAAQEKEARIARKKAAKEAREQAAKEARGKAAKVIREKEDEADDDQDTVDNRSGKIRHAPAEKDARFGRIEEQRGRLPQPVPGHGRRKPPGMFFQTQPATPVRAVYRGEVVYADWFRGYGLMIILGHGHRAYSLYGHNQRLLVNQGDWVNEGDKIAESGDTGSLEGIPGLYFEIRHQGKVDNPQQWLASGG
ncbi:MAG: peptidoglycan DD-metalloendopeptidase family protein [Magnetococcales bacterium]|nr:peptidoglycan DD-metalloendopeptidase family protein [Magnetococcales bacterium]